MAKGGFEGKGPNEGASKRAAGQKPKKIAPGKVTRTSKLAQSPQLAQNGRLRSGSPPTQTQQESALPTDADGRDGRGLTADWLKTAFRPDLYPPPIQRKRASAGEAGTPAPHPESGSGQAIPRGVQAKMENAFHTDFSEVRIHQDTAAASIGARAYTQGTDIHFAPGEYEPESQSGQELLGHELAHVVQQAEGRVRGLGQAKGADGAPVHDDPALEREADALGIQAARGHQAEEVASVGVDRTGQALAPVSGSSSSTIQTKPADEPPGQNAEKDAAALLAAFQGIGTSEQIVYRVLGQSSEMVRVVLSIYNARYNQHTGRGLVEDLRYEFDELGGRDDWQFVVGQLARAGIAVPGAEARYERQEPTATAQQRARIEASPDVRVAVPGTRITYTLVRDAELHAQGAHYQYQWYFLNDPETSQTLGHPARVEASEGPRVDARARFVGDHKIICKEVYHPADGDPQAPVFYEVPLRVVSEGDAVEDALQQPALAKLPPAAKAIFRAQLTSAAITPADQEQLFRIAETIAAMPPGHADDYASKISSAAPDLDALEQSLTAYAATMDQRAEQEGAHQATMTQLYGLEEVYAAYCDYSQMQTLELVQTGVMPAMGIISLLGLTPSASMGEALSAQLQAHGFASIEEFETHVRDFEHSFERGAANQVSDLLSQYQATLYRESQRYADPAELRALQQQLGARPASEDLAATYPIFAQEGLPEDARLDPEVLARLSPSQLGVRLRSHILERRNDVADVLERLDDDSAIIYRMDALMPSFYARQGIASGSIYDNILRDKQRDDAIAEIALGLTLALVAIALSIASFGLATPLVAGAAAAGAVGVGAYMVIDEYQAYVEANDLAELGLGGEPSALWLVLSVVGLGLDVAAAAKVVRVLGPAAKAFHTSGDANTFLHAVKAQQALGAIDAKIAAALTRATEAKAAFSETSSALGRALSGKLYSFPGPFTDPEVYRLLVQMAKAKLGEGVSTFEVFAESLKKQRALAKLGDMSPEELAKAKQAWKQASEAVTSARDLEEFKLLFKILVSRGNTQRSVSEVAPTLKSLLTKEYRVTTVTGGGRGANGVSTIIQSVDQQFSIRITHTQVGNNVLGNPPHPRIHIFRGPPSGHGSHVLFSDGTTLDDILRAIGD
ncbi:eCIS core domain-containing protein [Haliangium ochraceum]|uniref:DUF4157 domain-containing protein n=1 Tax=Haliangium ochraceum (strain DSM 14365 / JCM 11303 / SMP-2) TaxID=502025 RepID=D0LMU8_HALO1|nr:DUF4157 domain-containing protein [Haliangium ochraceum]ACY13319.1 hypothetical protein Hoch_0689 [Haliangium ochraceum DSM 14365]